MYSDIAMGMIAEIDNDGDGSNDDDNDDDGYDDDDDSDDDDRYSRAVQYSTVYNHQ